MGVGPASVAADDGQIVPSALLVERCRAYSHARASVPAQLCDAYLRGFLAGARTAGWLRAAPGEVTQETFSERAFRTRLPRTPRPQSCLPDGTAMSELITQLLVFADAHPGLADTDARKLLETMLRSDYPCGRKPAGSP
jgi:hypothetical protein